MTSRTSAGSPLDASWVDPARPRVVDPLTRSSFAPTARTRTFRSGATPRRTLASSTDTPFHHVDGVVAAEGQLEHVPGAVQGPPQVRGGVDGGQEGSPSARSSRSTHSTGSSAGSSAAAPEPSTPSGPLRPEVAAVRPSPLAAVNGPAMDQGPRTGGLGPRPGAPPLDPAREARPRRVGVGRERRLDLGPLGGQGVERARCSDEKTGMKGTEFTPPSLSLPRSVIELKYAKRR